jgi:hypothetical protein
MANEKTKEPLSTKIVQGVITALIIAQLYLTYDFRDFMKFIQPMVNAQQQEYIKDVDKKINCVDSMMSVKVGNLNQRDDSQSSTVNELKRDVSEIKDDVQFIKNFIIGKKNYSQNN